MKKSYKMLSLCIISITIFIVILVIINMKLYFNKRYLVNYPPEITKYSLNGTTYESKVENINVVRSDVKMGVKTEYCEIYLTDNSYKRIVYICIVSKYNGKGDWILESWKPYADEVIEDISNN